VPTIAERSCEKLLEFAVAISIIERKSCLIYAILIIVAGILICARQGKLEFLPDEGGAGSGGGVPSESNKHGEASLRGSPRADSACRVHFGGSIARGPLHRCERV